MYVYVQSEPTLWTVGHYAPSGTWHAESDHGTPAAAAARVHFLNGGKGGIIADLRSALRSVLESWHPADRAGQTVHTAAEKVLARAEG